MRSVSNLRRAAASSGLLFGVFFARPRPFFLAAGRVSPLRRLQAQRRISSRRKRFDGLRADQNLGEPERKPSATASRKADSRSSPGKLFSQKDLHAGRQDERSRTIGEQLPHPICFGEFYNNPAKPNPKPPLRRGSPHIPQTSAMSTTRSSPTSSRSFGLSDCEPAQI